LREDLRNYGTVDDLPFVYRYHLPAPALELFREVYNRTLQQCSARRDRDRMARVAAIAAVKDQFMRDPFGTWRRRDEENGP
jgi:cation transport regulator ChaB